MYVWFNVFHLYPCKYNCEVPMFNIDTMQLLFLFCNMYKLFIWHEKSHECL